MLQYRFYGCGDRPATRLKRKGVYLITGGLGGMGLAFAGFLAGEYGARLVLTTRREFPPQHEWELFTREPAGREQAEVINKLLEMKRLGAEVLVCRADVSVPEDMQRVVADAFGEWGVIDGVIHAAGMADGRLISLRNRADMEEILKAKLSGALVLTEVFRGREPDFMVYCSSLTAITGAIGELAYTAANQFLDSYAVYLARQGQEGVISINWPGWKGTGMFAAAGLMTELEKQNMTISPAAGIEIFRRALENGIVNPAAAAGDMENMIKNAQSVSPDNIASDMEHCEQV